MTLTRIEFESNRNERWSITVSHDLPPRSPATTAEHMSTKTDCSPKFQIYESNTEPHSYALNAKFGGTNNLPRNNIIVSIGSTFEAAFRRFRKFFEAKTHVAWEDRVRFAHERDRLELARSERRSVSSKSREVFREVSRDNPDYDKTPFQYHLPTYGPVGLQDIQMPSRSPTDNSNTIQPNSMASDVGADRVKRQDSPHPSAQVDAFATGEFEENLSSSAAVQGSKAQAQPDHLMDQSPAGSEVSVSKKHARTDEEEDDQMRSAKFSKL